MEIINGDCLEELGKMAENSIDAIVTDPPYELNFMGKGWDNAGISFQPGTWEKCLRVLKPGGYLLAFGGSRTYHRIACAIEDAGFELKDCIMWLYGSGMPHGIDLGRATKSPEWKGWNSSLKPSYEPIIVARKSFKGSLVDNVLENGVGGLNIDECRTPEGRFPANTILTYSEEDKDEVCGGLPSGGKNGSISKRYKMNNQVYGEYGYCNTWTAYDDSGSAARYFYCAKATAKDRNEGLEGRNPHTTVKPTELMQHLVRLVAPKGATILDPFMGSGSTGKAIAYENNERGTGYKFIGVEQSEEYCKVAEARIKYAIEG